MMGSFTGASIWAALGLTIATGPLGVVFGLILTLIVTMLVTGSLNVLIERVAYKPLRNAPKLAPLITAIGFSFVLQNVGLLWQGGNPVAVADLIQSRRTRSSTSPASPIHHRDVLAIGVMIPLVMALNWFVNRTVARPRDARHRPGPGGRPADGHQRQQHDLADVHARRDARRRGRHHLRAVRREYLVLPGLPGRPVSPSPPRSWAASAISAAPCSAA